MNMQEKITFNGIEYKLMGARKYYLSQSKTNEGRRHSKGLHVAIWEFYNKKAVPKDCCVHHIDGNTFNNDIINLECVPIKEHLSAHAKNNLKNPIYVAERLEILNKAREKATEWHRSPAGHEWHLKHSKEIAEKNINKTYKGICLYCGKETISKQPFTMFCNDECGRKYKKKNGKYDYESLCVICGEKFKGTKNNSYAPKRQTCSKTCANRLNYQNRKIKSLQSTSTI